jgi:hypothetical protein
MMSPRKFMFANYANKIFLENGRPGAVITIHIFGDYAEKFHPHIHAQILLIWYPSVK